MHQVILEGCDGSGKSTLAARLVKLINERVPTWVARAVTGPCDSIKGLRRLALHGVSQTLDGSTRGKPVAAASAALIIADMAQTAFAVQHWSGVVTAQGQTPIIIRDRTILTTLIYQGFLGGGPAQVQSIWTAYRNLVDEQFDRVVVLTGQHKRVTKPDYITDTGQCRHVRDLYTSIEHLLGPRTTYTPRRDPGLEREMARALTSMDRASFAARFPMWSYIDTDAYDEEGTAEHVFALLSNYYKWTKP